MTINCPKCPQEHEPQETADGTYTDTCVVCLTAFSYVIEDGEIKTWKAPIVTQAYKGAGAAGGK